MEKPTTKSNPEGVAPSDAPVVSTTTPIEENATPVVTTRHKQTDDSLPIVIAAYQGTEDLLITIWKAFLPKWMRIIVVESDPATNVLPLLIADTQIPDEFIFVPANCVPTSSVDISDLMQQKVYVCNDGTRKFGMPLPMLLKKASLVELLGTATSEFSDNEALFAAYAKLSDIRPMEVSHEFGNFITLVLRSNPCENVVMEGICRRKFIATSSDGWKAITHLLTKIIS